MVTSSDSLMGLWYVRLSLCEMRNGASSYCRLQRVPEATQGGGGGKGARMGGGAELPHHSATAQ